jgi:hypothetical protein
MKKSFFLILSLFVLSCTHSDRELEEKVPEIMNTETNSSFNNCFPAPDTNFVQTAIGCGGGSYKLINDEHVLRIYADQVMDYGDCMFLTNDSLAQNFNATLVVFNKGEASLANICTDVVSMDAPSPIETLNDCQGSITIGQSDPTEYYGNEMPKMSIMVHYLVFENPRTGEKIEIENELFWKVLNTGSPG